MGKKKKKGEAKSKDDDVDDVQHELDIKHALEQQPLERDHLLLHTAVAAAAAASPTAILRVPGYGSSKLDDAEHGMWLRNLSASQREEYLSKLDDAERAVQLGKLTPRLYVEYFQRRAENTEQPSTGTTAAQFVAIAAPETAAAIATTVAIAAPEEAAAIATPAAAQAVAIAAPERAVAIATPVAIAAPEQAAAIATHSGSEEEIERLQLLLTSQQAATTAAIAAAKEAAAAATTLEIEVKRLLLLLAATTAKVFVPGYTVPMTPEEHLHALHRQVQYLLEQQQYTNEQHCAAASHAQYWAERCFTAETANAAGTATTAIIPVIVPKANEPSREEHTQPQPAALIAKGNFSTTYVQAVKSSDPPLVPLVKRPRTRPDGRDSPTNPRASAAAAPESSLTELRHNPVAESPAAAALRTAANAAAAAAECDDPRILQTVLVAAAATANALAHTGAQGTVQAHRRGGRPPPMTRRRANPGARSRRNRRPTGTAPRATGSRTMPANQTRQHDPPIYSPPRAGQARPQPGAQPPSFSNRSATLATGNIPPLSPTVMRRNIVDRA
jgi:hypothetical protein